ncbi:MAG: portal protein, partial [Bacteroidetes bacterium]
YDFIEPLQKNAVFDTDGHPIHERGRVATAQGLYFLSLRFQYSMASQSIYGMVKDAQYVAQQITANNLPLGKKVDSMN